MDIVAIEWAMRSEGRYYAKASWEWLTSGLLPGIKEEWALVLKNIAMQSCWVDRCNLLYRGGESPPPEVTANRILLTFNDTLRAHEQHLNKLRGWWQHRLVVGKAKRDAVEEALKGISKELVTVQGFHWGRTDQSPEAGSAHSVGYLPLSDTNKARFWAL